MVPSTRRLVERVDGDHLGICCDVTIEADGNLSSLAEITITTFEAFTMDRWKRIVRTAMMDPGGYGQTYTRFVASKDDGDIFIIGSSIQGVVVFKALRL